jgi:PAS domain S-box-containing protein
MVAEHVGGGVPIDEPERRLARAQIPLEDLVESSDVPLGVLELPSGRALAANQAMADVLGLPLDELIGSTVVDLVVPEEREGPRNALEALASGALTGYQAVRRYRAAKRPAQELAVWVCAVDLGGGLVGLVSTVPWHERGVTSKAATTVMSVPVPGELLFFTLDREWRIDRVSRDVVKILGYSPEDVAGQPFLGLLGPADAPSFLAAVEHARSGRRTVRVTVHVRAKSGDWVPLTAELATLSDDFPPALALALALSSDHEAPGGATGGTERSRLDAELQRIARDLRVTGVVPKLDRLPDATRFPALARLTSREWEILVLLLDGQRVPSMAADLYVSQSTVRNHLSAIFSKLGAHSQADLIRQLRSG